VRSLAWLSFALAACCASLGFSQPAPSKPLSESLERAFKLITDGEFQRAKAELDRAAAQAAGPCGECLLGMSHIYASEEKWDQVVEAAQQALPLLSSSELQARAYNQLAVAHVSLGDLARAEETLRRAAALGGSWGAVARYNLAEVYARQQRWAETVEAARRYLAEAGPEGTSLKEARILLCRARARLPDGAPLPEEEELPPSVPKLALKPPELIAKTKPTYTAEARQAGTSGTVELRAVVDREGCVTEVQARKAQPNGLTESAMRAMRRWVFHPAMLGQKPVKAFYELTINFQAPKENPPQPPA
jgi:TonB family protein